MKRIIHTLACWLVCAATVLAANVVFYTGPTGQTLYLRIQNPAGNYVATALSEGASGGEGDYYKSEANVAALTGMSSASTGNGCRFRVYVGGTPSTTATDPIIAFGFLPWTGSAEIPLTPAGLLATDNSGNTVAEQLAHLDGDIATVTTQPISQAPVPTQRLWVLKRTTGGLVGERPIHIKVGESVLFGADFRNDLATNGRLIGVGDVVIADGTANGVTFTTDSEGYDNSIAKFKTTAVTADTYKISVQVSYDDSDGGGTATGTVTLVVDE